MTGLPRIALLFAVAWATLPDALAQDAQGGTLPEQVAVNTGLLQITLNLLLVLAAIVVLAWLFRRVQGYAQPAAGQLRVAASLPLGPKERLLLVDVGEEQILIGASSAGLTRLHVMGEPLRVAEPGESVSFKARLARALGKEGA